MSIVAWSARGNFISNQSKAPSSWRTPKLSRYVAPHVQQQIDAGTQGVTAVFIHSGTDQLIAIAEGCFQLFRLPHRADDDRFRRRHDLLVIADALVVAKVPRQRPVIR